MNFKLKLIITGILIIIFYWLFIRNAGVSKGVEEIDNLVKSVLTEFKIEPSDLVKEVHEFKKIRFRHIETISKVYNVFPSFSFDNFRSALEKKLHKMGLHILSWERNIKEKTYHLELGFKTIKLYDLILKAIKREITKITPLVKKAKVAIVIDDFGYNMKDVDLWVNFEKPITFSILPNLNYSTQIAHLANRAGREVILHLPLESKNEESEPLEQFTITVSMSKREILKLLNNAFKSISFLKGVSNHQGSRATEDKRVMEIILEELKKRNFYFLDSLVTNRSVCQEIASRLNLEFAQRDVFLDNVNDVEYIKGQLNKLVEIAQTRGFAIGIGHVHSKILEVLKEICPLLEERGIEFVYLSELVK